MTNKKQREEWEKAFKKNYFKIDFSSGGNLSSWLAACEYMKKGWHDEMFEKLVPLQYEIDIQQKKIDVLYSAFRNSVSLGAFVCDSEQRQLAKARELRNYEAEIIEKIKELDESEGK